MKKIKNTTIEIQLMTIIRDFIKWDFEYSFNRNTINDKEDYEKAQEYINYVSENKHYNFNKWFRVTKDDVIKFIENNLNEEVIK